ncbi:SgcJ/EcaC family oxidoreductase [Nocardia asteroides]
MSDTLDRTTDDARIRALFADLMRAWTDNDAEAYAGCFTDDSDYVSYDGTRAICRAEHQHNHDKLFRGVLAGSALVGDVESVRFLTPDVAILHGTASVLMPWRSRLPERKLSRQTLVLLRTPPGWRVTAIHNGRVRPVTIPDPGSFPARMSHFMGRAARTLGLGSRRPAP